MYMITIFPVFTLYSIFVDELNMSSISVYCKLRLHEPSFCISTYMYIMYILNVMLLL